MNRNESAELSLPDLKQLADRARLIAQPIDFDQLTADGLLRKAGAWYEAPGAHKLPEHVTAKIRATRFQNGRIFFKFTSTSGAEKLVRQLERLGY